MRIEQPHTLGRQEAMIRLERFLDQLVQAPPGGVTIKDARKDWDGGRMTFSFTAAKGPFGTSIRGLMDVLDGWVVVESELPMLVKNFLGEDRIQHAIANGLEDILRA